MAIFFIFCSSACSLLIAHLLKFTRSSVNLRTLPVLTVNYIAAALFVIITKADILPQLYNITWPVYAFAFFIGIVFIINFFIYSASVDKNGVGVSVAAMRLSLLVPVLVSIMYYNEQLTLLKTAGIILVFAALMLLIPRLSFRSIKKTQVAMLIPLLFLFSGLGDTGLKVFDEEVGAYLNETLFMGLVFLSAFVAGILYMAATGALQFTQKELLTGIAIGIPNLYSSIFLLWSLTYIEGAIAFSMVNILNVTGGTLLGILYWKDAVVRKQIVGIATALIAILMLI